MASASTLCSRIRPKAAVIGVKKKSTRPAARSATPSAVPLNGTCVALKPALRPSRSAVRLPVLPGPIEA